MRLSKRCQYGIKAAVKLAASDRRGYLQAREIAAAEALPAKFLESILLALRSAGVLESKVGAGGGYRLARPAATISVGEIIRALEHEREDDDGSCSEDGEIPSLGTRALGVIYGRVDDALTYAVGSLSLHELATGEQPAAGPIAGEDGHVAGNHSSGSHSSGSHSSGGHASGNQSDGSERNGPYDRPLVSTRVTRATAADRPLVDESARRSSAFSR